MLRIWVLEANSCPRHPAARPPRRPAPYLQQPLGAVLQDPLEVPQAFGGPVAAVRSAGRRVSLQQSVGGSGGGGGGRAGRRVGLGQHEGVAAVAVLYPVVTPAAAPLQRPALGSGHAQHRRGTGQGHEAEAESPHGTGVPVAPGWEGGGIVKAGCLVRGCAGTSQAATTPLFAGMGQWALAAESKRCNFGISSL